MIYKFRGDYYVTDGYMMLHCDYDVIKELQLVTSMPLPENDHGYEYTTKDGWRKDNIENFIKYISRCSSNIYWEKPVTVVDFKPIKYGKDGIDCIVCTLSNSNKVLLDKQFVNVLSVSKKWGWFAEGFNSVSAVRFRNKKNPFGLWIMPIVYEYGTID